MGKTNIGWTEYSLNFIKWYCTRISPGCVNCYMLEMAKRYPQAAADRPVWRDRAWDELRRIPRGAEVFVGDMYDVFHERMPLRFIHAHFNAAAYLRPDLKFLMLTKRIERALALSPYLVWAPNIWLGTSVESAEYAWRIDYLRRIPAKGRFISFEPLLGDVGDVDLSGIDGVIVGGESGANRRPFDKAWAVGIHMLTRRDGVCFYLKQGSAHKPGQDRELYGQTYDELPWRSLPTPTLQQSTLF